MSAARRSPGRGAFALTDRYKPRTDRRFAQRVVAAALAVGRQPRRAVSLLLTGDAEIKRLHGEWLGDPTTTDVLSFETDDVIDVAVNIACARREAKRRGHSIRAEVALYIAHGVLHACGFDDRNTVQRARMRRAERDVLERIGVRIAAVDDE